MLMLDFDQAITIKNTPYLLKICFRKPVFGGMAFYYQKEKKYA
jgi:hypothetical protein